MNGEPAGLALEGGKLAGFVVLQDFFHAAEFTCGILQAHAGAEAGGGMAGGAGGFEHVDFGVLVDWRFDGGHFSFLVGVDFGVAGQGDGNVADSFNIVGSLEAGAGELLLDLGGGLAEADAADAAGLNQTFGGGGCGKGGDKEGFLGWVGLDFQVA